jgi:hypothetical protein
MASTWRRPNAHAGGVRPRRASAISVLNAQSNAPDFEVAAVNVTDKAGYEASGVDNVRDAIKAGGGKLIAGGCNKATTLEGDGCQNRPRRPDVPG